MAAPQLLPPAAEAELHSVDFLSSIFIAWPSNFVTVDTPRTAFPFGFIPFDTGIRVAPLRPVGTSELGWKNEEDKISDTGEDLDQGNFCVCGDE